MLTNSQNIHHCQQNIAGNSSQIPALCDLWRNNLKKNIQI